MGWGDLFHWELVMKEKLVRCIILRMGLFSLFLGHACS